MNRDINAPHYYVLIWEKKSHFDSALIISKRQAMKDE